MQRQASNTPHVYFNQICQRLVEHIEESEVVLGCVAWITHSDVLEALSRKRCCIIIQQEDWSVEYRKTWYQQYQTLTPVEINDLRKVCPQLRNLKNYVNTAIRTVNLPQTGKQQPRMHHKFLIMFKKTGVGIWTGSFNITQNACQSLENAMYIDFDPYIKPFVNEFFHILCLSCELDDVWQPYKYFKLTDGKALTDYTQMVPLAIPCIVDVPLITFDSDIGLTIDVEPIKPTELLEPIQLSVDVEPIKPIVESDDKYVDLSVQSTLIDNWTRGIRTIPVSQSVDYVQKRLSTTTVLSGLAAVTNSVRSILYRKSM